MTTFEDFNLSEQLLSAIKRLNFEEPTQIQRDSIPLILQGKDVIGESATGSGKTLAFGAGIIEKTEAKEGIQAIVLVPTRELAEQVKDEIVKLSFDKNLNVIAIYGGVSINPQMKQLKKADIIIATPGRTLDHMNRGTMDLSNVKIVVLDEADKMVEMGFITDVEKIISACPKKRQNLLFSATMYGPAKSIAQRYMNNPILVRAEQMVDPTKLTQVYYDVPSKNKKDLLVHLLKQETSDLVMIFCNTRRGVDMVVDTLKANDIKAAAIHGGLNQAKRLLTIDQFHKGKYQVLVCTDVAARGLHINDVTHIYNFDIPNEPGDYVHRIGRTARAGKTGLVVNVLTYRDYDNFSRLLNTYREFDIQKKDKPEITMEIKAPSRTTSSARATESRRGNRGDSRGGSRGGPRGDSRGGSRGGSSRRPTQGSRSTPRDGERSDRRPSSGSRPGSRPSSRPSERSDSSSRGAPRASSSSGERSDSSSRGSPRGRPSSGPSGRYTKSPSSKKSKYPRSNRD